MSNVPHQREDLFKGLMDHFSEGFDHGQRKMEPAKPESPDYMEGHQKGLESLRMMGNPGGTMDRAASNDRHEATDHFAGLISEADREALTKEACDCGPNCECDGVGKTEKEASLSEDQVREYFTGRKTASQLNEGPILSDATPENYYELTPPIFPMGEVPSSEQELAEAEATMPNVDLQSRVAWRGREYELIGIDKVAMEASLFDFRSGQFLEVPDTEISKIAYDGEDHEGDVSEELKEPAHKPKVD